MVKHVARTITFALALFAMTAPAVYASATSSVPASGSTAGPSAVTGGDPEPISPHVIEWVLAFLHLV